MYLEAAGEKVVGLEIVAKGRKGLLRDIAGLIAEKGLFIKKFVHSLPKDDDKLLIFLVIDEPENLKELLNEMKRINGVLNVRLSPRYNKMVYTRSLYPMLFASKQAVIIGAGTMEGLTLGLARQTGSEVAELILLSIGYQVGTRVFEIYSDIIGFVSIEDSIRFLDALFSSTGWGRVAEYSVSENTITLILENLWECEVVSKKKGYREPSYTKGILKGFFSNLLKQNVTVTFLKTFRKARRTLCVFKVIRKGLPPEPAL